MSHAVRSDDDPPPDRPRDLEAEAAALITRTRAAADAIMHDPRNQAAVDELAICNVRSAELGAGLRAAAAGQAALAAAFAAGVTAGEARVRAEVPVPRKARDRGRHAMPGQLALVKVKGAVLPGLAAAWAVLRGVARHTGAAAHPVLAAGAGTAAAAALTAAAALAPGSPLAHRPPAAVPAPAASAEAAVPFAAPSSAPGRAGRAGAETKTSGSWPPVHPAPPPFAAPSPGSGPAGSVPADPPSASAGTLTADVAALGLPDASGSYAGQVTLTAQGGPVTWGAVSSDSSVSLGAAQGTLLAGESVTLTVTVNPAAQSPAGTATVTVYPGDITIGVTWAALPVLVPSASPSPS